MQEMPFIEYTQTLCALCNKINENPNNYSDAQREACTVLENRTAQNIFNEIKNQFPGNCWGNDSIAIYDASNELASLVSEEDGKSFYAETVEAEEKLHARIIELLDIEKETLSAEIDKLAHKINILSEIERRLSKKQS